MGIAVSEAFLAPVDVEMHIEGASLCIGSPVKGSDEVMLIRETLKDEVRA